MSKLLALCVLGLCGLELVAAGCFSLFGKTSEQKLNCHLKQMKLERDADLLMNKTIEWYEQEFGANKMKDPNFEQFLVNVISLKEASSECSDENIKIAGRVARTTSADLIQFNSNSNLAEFMIAKFLARLSIKCEQRFLEQINAQVSQVDRAALNNVNLFAHNYAYHTTLYKYVLQNPRRSSPTTERFLKDMLVPQKNRMKLAESVYNNFITKSGGKVPHMKRGDCNRLTIEKLYRKYFVGACVSYLSAIDASTFDDFLNYLEEFGQPGKSRSGFPFIIDVWIDYEVCKNVIAGKSYLETIYSVLLYCGPIDGQVKSV